MKKKILLLAATSNMLISLHGSGQRKSSETFMFTRPAYHNIVATNFGWRNFIADKQGECGTAVRGTFLFQKSIDDCEARRYFLINCKTALIIAGDNTGLAQSRDVRAEWLGLPSTFTGAMSVLPRQRQIGAVFTYNQDLGKIFDSEFLDDSWVAIEFPFLRVENQLLLEHANLKVDGVPVSGEILMQAFNRPNSLFANIARGKRCITGLAEIRCLLGTNWTTKNDFLLQYYGGIILPTAPKVNPEFLFSPVLGTNHHWGLIAGVNAELPLHEEGSECQFKIIAIGEVNYLFHNHQLRTLDLQGKPWSRYLMLRTADDPTLVPAANIFTVPVTVHPFGFVNLAGGFQWAYGDFKAEAGYQLWAHPSECIFPCNSCCEGVPPLIQSYGIAGTGTGSASQSTIKTQAPNDSSFTTLYLNNLNPLSGSGRKAFTQMGYGALGYVGKRVLVTIGGFIEQPTNDTALQQWGLWATVGVTF